MGGENGGTNEILTLYQNVGDVCSPIYSVVVVVLVMVVELVGECVSV